MPALKDTKKLPTLDEVINRYLQIRDDLTEKRREFTKYETDAKSKMERLSMWLRDRGDEQGVDSFNTKSGTAYRQEKTYVRVGDWEKAFQFIIETKNWQMLEKRLAKLATLEVLDQLFEDDQAFNAADLGIDYSAEVEFTVRKPSKQKGKK